MSFAAIAVGAGSSIIGGAIQSGAAKDAANKQKDAAMYATDLQREMWEDDKSRYEQQRADLEPWRAAGVRALGGLENADFQRDFSMKDFQKDPGYDFRMSEGQKALERSAAARGGLQSGGTLKALTRYGQDFASNEFNNAYNRFNADRDRRFNRLSSLAGIGQTANSQIANNNAALSSGGQSFATNAGNNIMGAANAAGAAGIAGANAWGSALGGIGQNWMDMTMANKFMNKFGGK